MDIQTTLRGASLSLAYRYLSAYVRPLVDMPRRSKRTEPNPSKFAVMWICLLVLVFAATVDIFETISWQLHLSQIPHLFINTSQSGCLDGAGHAMMIHHVT